MRVVALEEVVVDPGEGEDVADVVVRRVNDVQRREGRSVPDSDRSVACAASELACVVVWGRERGRTRGADEPFSRLDNLESEDCTRVATQACAEAERVEVPDLRERANQSSFLGDQS